MIILPAILLALSTFSPLASSGPGDESCATAGCHGEMMKASVVHPPLADGCDGCHEGERDAHPAKDGAEFHLTAPVPELCFSCHEGGKGESVHAPFASGDCTTCHSPHGSEVKAQLLDTVPGLCLQCHDDVGSEITTKPTVHSVVTTRRSCLNCHSAHSAETGPLLSLPEPKVCFQCHGGATRRGDSLVVNIETRLRRGNTIHAPVGDGCSSCHTPHASENGSLLTSTFPSGHYTTPDGASFALCFECHDSGMLDAANAEATQFRNAGGQNLHAVHVMKTKAMSCVNCHDVHGSSGPFLIAETIRFGKWQMPLNFAATEAGGSCRPACHAEKSYSR